MHSLTAAAPALTIAASQPNDRHYEVRNLLPHASAMYDMPEQPAGWVYWNGTCWSASSRDAKRLTFTEAAQLRARLLERGTVTELRNAHRLALVGKVYAPALRADYADALDSGLSKPEAKARAIARAQALIAELFPADDVAAYNRH